MRFKPYARPELAAWDRYIDEPRRWKGRWRECFADGALPLRVELGCGKGGFLAGRALKEPGYNYLGIDIKSEMLVVAKRTMERLYAEAGRPLGNAAITSYNIEGLEGILAPEDGVERVYINFCNPWYKSGHAKHRLTHPRQLVQLHGLMGQGGEIWFKTDDTPLYRDSLRYFAMAGYEVVWSTEDLHADEPEWNVRTEHEAMFSEEGIAIKACIARWVPAQLDREAIARWKTV